MPATCCRQVGTGAAKTGEVVECLKTPDWNTAQVKGRVRGSPHCKEKHDCIKSITIGALEHTCW